MPNRASQGHDGSIHRVMSFDGGPSSMINVRVLAYMARQLEAQDRDLLTEVDLFAGVSDGNFAATFLASRAGTDKSSAILDACVQLLDEFICVIQPSWFDRLRFLSGLGPLETSHAAAECLRHHYGDLTMGELPARLLSASFALETWRPKLFMNFGAAASADADKSLVDVALACSAYPMLVNTHYIPGTALKGPGGVDGLEGQFVDGAIMGNNPTMTAISVAVSTTPGAFEKFEGGWQQLDELRVFSLGASVMPDDDQELGPGAGPRWFGGRIGSPSAGQALNWGWLQWNILQRNLYLNLNLQAAAGAADTQCVQILGTKRYQRLAPAVNELFAAAQMFLGDPHELLPAAQNIADKLIEGPRVATILRWIENEWKNKP